MDHGGWVLLELRLCHVRHRQLEGGGLSRSIKVTSARLEVIVQASHSPVPPPGSGHCCWDSKPSSDCTCTHHHDGTELPLQADWGGGASSSTGTMTPAEHGKKRHILAFAISSDWGDVLSVHRVALWLCKHFSICFITVIFKSTTKYLLYKIQKHVRG